MKELSISVALLHFYLRTECIFVGTLDGKSALDLRMFILFFSSS